MVIAAGETEDRVNILTIFIGIAHALFSSLGNLDGFMAVMEGLEATQVKPALLHLQYNTEVCVKSVTSYRPF
jgi:hypothetical protein